MPNTEQSNQELRISPLDDKAYNLLNYCLKNDDWAPDNLSKVIISFIDESSKVDELKSIWDIEAVNNILYDLLHSFKDKLVDNNPPVSRESSIEFTKLFRKNLKANIAPYWLIMPLHKAKLKDLIVFGDFLFIPDHLPRSKKLAILADKLCITSDEMNYRADHTEKSRSPYFYEYTLMCRKISHHTSFVQTFGYLILLLDFAILRVLKYSKELVTPSPFGGITLAQYHREDNKFILVCAQNSRWWNHIPIWTDVYSTTIMGDLGWLNDKDVQKNMIELEKSIGYVDPVDRLAFRFRRAAIFFSKALDLQLATRKSIFEGFGLALLHMMIAAESLLLDREAEKRLRLATLISRLVIIDNFSSEDVFTNIETCYNYRSDYVHSGNDVFPEYDEDFEEDQVQKGIHLVRHAIAKLISEAPKYLELANGLAQSSNQVITDKSRENAWFKYLENYWIAILSGSSSTFELS